MIKKSKRLAIAIALVSVIGSGVTASAVMLVQNSEFLLMYGEDNGAGYRGDLVTAQTDGHVREELSYQDGATPNSFKAVLEYKTAWYKPNETRDTSNNINGWNETYCDKGHQFRTNYSAKKAYGMSTKVNYSYENK